MRKSHPLVFVLIAGGSLLSFGSRAQDLPSLDGLHFLLIELQGEIEQGGGDAELYRRIILSPWEAVYYTVFDPTNIEAGELPRICAALDSLERRAEAFDHIDPLSAEYIEVRLAIARSLIEDLHCTHP